MFWRSTGSRGKQFGKVAIATRRDHGSLVLTNKLQLEAYPPTILDPLRKWARETPASPFLKERDGDGWTAVTYADFLRRAEDRADRILALGCGPERPLLILAANSIEHAITSVAAMIVGVPVSSVSPAYGAASSFERLQQIISILAPAAVYIGNPAAFARALPTISAACSSIVSHLPADGLRLIDDVAPAPKYLAAAARKSVGPDTIAKVLFTSGSTGAPKGVINTHRMMSSNQVALAQLWPFLKTKRPVLVDWLPWSHTFGGNVCFNVALFHGGVMHIDDGKPAPALIGRTVENLKIAPPNMSFNVPAGIEALLPILEGDDAFAKMFFEETQFIFVAAAALPQRARERLAAAALKATNRHPTLLAGWGSTETAPFATCVYFPTDSAANLGLPIPGTSIKMAPVDDKLALLVKGPNVTPGYWNNPEATRDAFDTEGFYHMGDAGRLLDPANPTKGIAFDGRLSENFKLTSGTWVNVGMLRVALVDQLRPLCTDVVVTGENQEDVGILIVPNFAHAAELAGKPLDALAPDILAGCAFGEKLTAAISAYNSRQSGGSTRIKRLAILPRAPDISRNEITDKGYINQRAMLASYADLVTAMHGEDKASDRAQGVMRL